MKVTFGGDKKSQWKVRNVVRLTNFRQVVYINEQCRWFKGPFG